MSDVCLFIWLLCGDSAAWPDRDNLVSILQTTTPDIKREACEAQFKQRATGDPPNKDRNHGPLAPLAKMNMPEKGQDRL